MRNPLYWINLYELYKNEAVCIDIETCYFNGPISVIGLYIPQKSGKINSISLVNGINLNHNAVKEAFSKAKLLITFNGDSFDLKKIKSEFPNTIPDVPHLDLYQFAKSLGYGASLRTLENTFGIKRKESESERKGIAIKQWKKYKAGDKKALAQLIEYNKQDTINLQFLAEQLIKVAKSKP